MSVYEASIDDNDPQVLYSSGWELVTQDGSWTGTMHSTSVIGSAARVRFTENLAPLLPSPTGSRVAVVCTIPTGNGQFSKASFALDNGSPVDMSHVTTPPVQWQTVFWDSGPLAFGSHLLVITNTGNEAYFRLDHIDYDPTSASSPSSSAGSGAGKTTTVESTLISTVVVGSSPYSSGSSGSAITSNSGSGTASPSQTGSLTSTHDSGTSLTTSSPTGTYSGSTVGATAGDAAAATSSSNKSTTSTASIVAGVMGALLGIVLVVLVLLYLRRRRRRTSRVHLNDGDMAHRSENTVIPTPFSLNSAPSEMSSTNHRSNPSSLGSPHGSSTFDTTSSSPINSMSMYTSGSDPATMMGGHYGQQQFQHLGAAAGTVASRMKRAEFIAEQQQQQQQGQLVDAPPVLASVVGDQDAPPAYSGRGY